MILHKLLISCLIVMFLEHNYIVKLSPDGRNSKHNLLLCFVCLYNLNSCNSIIVQ